MSVVVIFLAHEYSMAQANSAPPVLNVGVVSVGRALRECKAMVKYKEQTTAEDNKMNAEEEKLSKEIQAMAAGLRVLIPSSNDYLTQYKEFLQKQAELKAMQEFNPQQKALKHQQWTQVLYQEILRITKVLAAEKGLPLVLGSDEPEFPIQRYEELAMTLSTHKVLYSNGCSDLTDEVIAELDKEESKFIN
jgi:Skp family chaperone for outer membrane proteins